MDEETVVLRQNFRNSFKKHRQSAPNLLDRNLNDENLLPATLTFLENGKDAFFATVISEVNGAAVNFKLAPTYTLYLVARHVYSPAYRPGLNPVDRSKVITSTTKRIATSVQQTIQVHKLFIFLKLLERTDFLYVLKLLEILDSRLPHPFNHKSLIHFYSQVNVSMISF